MKDMLAAAMSFDSSNLSNGTMAAICFAMVVALIGLMMLVVKLDTWRRPMSHVKGKVVKKWKEEDIYLGEEFSITHRWMETSRIIRGGNFVEIEVSSTGEPWTIKVGLDLYDDVLVGQEATIGYVDGRISDKKVIIEMLFA